MKHLGYEGKITHIDEETGILTGEVIGIRDVIHFQGETMFR